MWRVLEVILLGGGSIGALAGWLLTRWLDARTHRKPRVLGVARESARAGEPVTIDMGPVPPPGGLPPRLYGPCLHVGGPGADAHVCARRIGHTGPHVCTCSAAPQPHMFA